MTDPSANKKSDQTPAQEYAAILDALEAAERERDEALAEAGRLRLALVEVARAYARPPGDPLYCFSEFEHEAAIVAALEPLRG